MQSFQVSMCYDNYSPQKSIVPLNEIGQKHGEENIYQYPIYNLAEDQTRIDYETLNTDEPWKLIATKSYINGKETGTYKFFFDEEFTDEKGCCYFMIKSEKHYLKKNNKHSIYSLYRNGHIIEAIPHVNDVPHGYCEYYSRPKLHIGQPMFKWCEKYTYINGIKHGPANCYTPDGTLYKSYTYVDGQKHGEYKKFYPSGRLMLIRYMHEGERCGTETCYYGNGTINWTVTYDRDVPGTKHVYREDGTLKEIEEMDNKFNSYPRMIETTYYKEDGITVESVWKNKITGKYEYASGQHHSTLLIDQHIIPSEPNRSLIINRSNKWMSAA